MIDLIFFERYKNFTIKKHPLNETKNVQFSECILFGAFKNHEYEMILYEFNTLLTRRGDFKNFNFKSNIFTR